MLIFNYPPRFEGTPEEQREQLYRYLFALTDTLNMLVRELERQKDDK